MPQHKVRLGWKVVRDSKSDIVNAGFSRETLFISATECGRVRAYFPHQWTTPMKYDGPLAVFSSLLDAETFMNKTAGTNIVPCLYVPSTRKKERALRTVGGDLRDAALWMGYNDDYIAFGLADCVLPDGSDTAEKVYILTEADSLRLHMNPYFD